MLIVGFTIVIILRYLLLLLFSTLNIIKSATVSRHKRNNYFKVSVIVPAFNEEVVIAKLIKSILNQSYPFIEIIIVDDGSKDGTFRLAKMFEFIEGSKSLKILTKPNGGKAST